MTLVLQPAMPADVPTLFQLIQALAAYEQLSHAVTGNTEDLAAHLFGSRPYGEAILARWDGDAVGFALFFHTYSTFLTRPGLYLEDLFVQPDYRRRGIGKALISQVAKIAVERGCGRLEWTVLDWNAPAIAFYQGLGSDVLPDWRVCRVMGTSLGHLATMGAG
ncbi:GNAT family acetyltransferase [Neosynechococcus sphagnicola sy1]|uniref:GNAT family acetyltransferase n=2 Tax=Neosynechococcus TaxID=1501143 RepID=A0A098THC4_9CYAN|nr:GNAT family N-acetyltransferase [Neosynechococcus sphagnicola]KGF71985.1 GNAT family acetyltransferase [Neosynechococcus sphagnicola sy1]